MTKLPDTSFVEADIDRQDFERWAAAKWWFNSSRYPDGEYSDNATRAAWETWGYWS